LLYIIEILSLDNESISLMDMPTAVVYLRFPITIRVSKAPFLQKHFSYNKIVGLRSSNHIYFNNYAPLTCYI